MKLVILGAGTSIPAKNYSPAGIYLRVKKENILLDAGPGTLQRLNDIGLSPFDLDRVFLTHYHVDHCLELVTLLFALRIPNPGHTKSLTIYGPKGLKRLYRQLNKTFQGWLTPRKKSYQLKFIELGRSVFSCGGYRVKTIRMNHSTEAIGYRISDGARSVTYSGDTDMCPEIITLGKSTDALILECSMKDENKMAGHLTPSECGQIAASAGCKQLVLTHFYPVFRNYDIRRRVRCFYSGSLTLARDKQTINLK